MAGHGSLLKSAKSGRFAVPLACLVLLSGPGCQQQQKTVAVNETTEPAPVIETRPTPKAAVVKPIQQPPPPRPRVPMGVRKVVGQSVEGRPIETFEFGSGPDCILIMATIHGDEDAGTPLVYRLIDLLHERKDFVDGRRIVIMPVANPDGMAANSRYNSRGVDLNRNYPADNFRKSKTNGRAPLSEPESVVIERVLSRERPDRIVSIHQRRAGGCIDHDGPAQDLALAMGRHAPMPVEKIGSRPGSLGSYAGLTLGIPIITFELPRHIADKNPDRLWGLYGDTLLAAITFPQPLTTGGF